MRALCDGFAVGEGDWRQMFDFGRQRAMSETLAMDDHVSGRKL